MDLTNSLLLCVLAMLLPCGSGRRSMKESKEHYKFNNTIALKQKPYSAHKVLINSNNQPKQVSVFEDNMCNHCKHCMELAIEEKESSKVFGPRRMNSEEMHNDILTNTVNHKVIKRHTGYMNKTEYATKKDKKLRSKKHKEHKTVLVTKYSIDGKVIALKVKETSAKNNYMFGDETTKTMQTTCEVFKVKDRYRCESPEVDILMKLVKRKSGKKQKKEKDRTTEGITATEETTTEKTSPAYRKRYVDNSQMPENVMSSVEEFY